MSTYKENLMEASDTFMSNFTYEYENKYEDLVLEIPELIPIDSAGLVISFLCILLGAISLGQIRVIFLVKSVIQSVR